jgi:hypothetical protein
VTALGAAWARDAVDSKKAASGTTANLCTGRPRSRGRAERSRYPFARDQFESMIYLPTVRSGQHRDRHHREFEVLGALAG